MKNKIIIWGTPVVLIIIPVLFFKPLFELINFLMGVNLEHSELAGVVGLFLTLIIVFTVFALLCGIVEAVFFRKIKYFFVGLGIYLLYLAIVYVVLNFNSINMSFWGLVGKFI